MARVRHPRPRLISASSSASHPVAALRWHDAELEAVLDVTISRRLGSAVAAFVALVAFGALGVLGGCDDSNSAEPGATEASGDDGIEWVDISVAPDQLGGDAAEAKNALCDAQVEFVGALTGLDSASSVADLGIELDRGVAALAVLSSNNSPPAVASDAAAGLAIWQRARTLMTDDMTDDDIARVVVEAGFRFAQTRETMGRLRDAILTCT
jgi:hypothetical protein